MTHHNKRSPEVRPGELAPGAPSGRAQSAQPRRVYPRSRGKSSPRGVPCRVHTAAGQRTVGLVVEGPEGRELVKRVRGSKHLLRSADAWGLDAGRAESLRRDGVGMVRVHDLETGICYSASLDYLLEHGFRRDFGHGPQVFLPRSQWSRSGAGQLQLLTH